MLSSNPEINAKVLVGKFLPPELIRATAKYMLLILTQQQYEVETPCANLTPKEAIAACDGRRDRAAKTMGISRSTLYRRLQKEV